MIIRYYVGYDEPDSYVALQLSTHNWAKIIERLPLHARITVTVGRSKDVYVIARF